MKFILNNFSWAQLASINNGGYEGFYTEEFLFNDIDRAGFQEAWNEHAKRKNTRRYRGNWLQEWGLPRRLLLFWSE